MAKVVDASTLSSITHVINTFESLINRTNFGLWTINSNKKKHGKYPIEMVIDNVTYVFLLLFIIYIA